MALTTKEKLNRLDRIKDEVSEFHPILNSLFRTLPNISSVEYTHGPNELGADFVLEREDPVLQSRQYVGVIVKTGKISLSNVQDVQRQVNDCKLERFHTSGKRKIYLNSVWVVSNSSISHHAKHHIFENNKSSNVEYLSGENLVGLIDKHFKSFWSAIGSEAALYLSRTLSDINDLESKLSLVKDFGNDVYIKPDIRKCTEDDYKIDSVTQRKKNEIVDLAETVATNQIIFIEGDPGVGKSKLLRNLSSEFCKPDKFKESSLIPVYFSFKEYCETYEEDIHSLIESKLGDSYETLDSIKGRKYLLVSDSLDECKTEDRDTISVLESIFAKVNEDDSLKLIATSRHLDRFNIPKGLLDNICTLEIVPLSGKKVISFLKELLKNASIPERIIEDAKRSSIFKDLPKCPIAAILLGHILRQGDKELPSSLPELYSQFIEISVGRWELDKGLQSQKEYKALDKILQNIAVHMLEAGVDRLNRGEAESFFCEYLDNRNFGIDAFSFFEKVTNRCSIICLLDSGNTFAFKHRSFIEYYYARKMIGSNNLDINNKAFTKYWSHVFYFFIGLAPEPDHYLKQIIGLEPKSELECFAKYMNLSDFLLSGYSAKYSVVIDGLVEATKTASKTYMDVIKNKDTSMLANFSQIHLLWLTQYNFKMSFAYSFFEKAFDSVALQLISDIEDEDHLAISMFLLDVTVQLNSKTSEFKYLEMCKVKPPIVLQLGLQHEMQTGKKSKFAKKLDKNFKTKMDGNGKLKSDVKKLYDTSLRDFSM